MDNCFDFLRIDYQVLGQFLHLKARHTFGYIIRITSFFHAEWITLEPNKEKKKQKKKKKKEKRKTKKKYFPPEGLEPLTIRSKDLCSTTELLKQLNNLAYESKYKLNMASKM